ncbi:MAG: IPT/TIG domain-containing protein [Acidobacteriota bacterium]
MGLIRLRTILILVATTLVLAFVAYSQTLLQVGYVVVSPGPASAAPVGTALFSFTNPQGVLLWEAGVAAAEPIRSGRIFAERSATTRTAIALVNASGAVATATLILRDAAGAEVACRPRSFAAGEHRAQFLEEIFDPLPDSFSSGSLTFESDRRLAAITLRENKNTQGEALYATLPVVDLAAAASTASLVFPHIAIGGGFSTQVVLVNASNQRVAGKIRLTRSDGTPLLLGFGSELPYDIPPNGTFRAELTSAGDVQVGYAAVVLEQGAAMPSGSAIFQIKKGNDVVSEAGVAAIAATRLARIFVDNAGTRTAVAIASAGNPATVVTVTLIDRNGNAIATTTTLDLPAEGHRARFVHELFPGLPEGFSGLMEISSPVPIVPVTLKLTTNQRGDTILTTLPIADLVSPATAASFLFPHIAFGQGYSTRLIFISTTKTAGLAGTMNFFQSDGAALQVPLGGQNDNQFSYNIGAGATRQFRPGSSATAQQIILDLADPNASEIAINEGNSLQLLPTVIDSDGNYRDDFGFNYQILSPEAAAIDANGRLRGFSAGFTTLRISAGTTAVTSATVNVVKISAGVTGGFQITGIAQDLARRVYLANTRDHTILLAREISATPERYAGVSQNRGLVNDQRLKARFDNPAFMAFNQAEGILYVSDGGNNVIRRVHPGPTGRVDTLSIAGSLNNPQGLALDNRGFLWVADSGSHTIRRVDLLTGAAQIVAGVPGSSGLADGVASQARFHTPSGICLEVEPLPRQLERERTGAPPPAVSVLVADTRNNRVRRVDEMGRVETVGVPAGAATNGFYSRQVTSPAVLNSPASVAIDSVGNIFVTEPGSSAVKVILAGTGRVVPAAQANTFRDPRGIVVTQNGRVLVGASDFSVQEIRYGEPSIAGVSPGRISARGAANITIKGRNFSSDTIVIVAGFKVPNLQIVDTQTLTFVAPVLGSGRSILSVQNRGGLAQTELLIEPIPLSELLTGDITTFAGGTTYAGEGAAATAGSLSSPRAVTLDSAGNLYIADTDRHRIRRVDALTGIMTTVAGTGVQSLEDFEGPATQAELSYPQGIAIDAQGNLLIADTGSNRIRRVDAKTGIISTVAGRHSSMFGSGFDGDGRAATSALLNGPKGITVDAQGNLYIADTGNNRIRRVDSSGFITTIAGNGQGGYSGDGVPATATALNLPKRVTLDSSGNIYIADTDNHRVRKINAANQTISTIAGNGQEGLAGDNILATNSSLRFPHELAFDSAGNIFIAESGHHRIRKIDTSGVITTLAGTGERGSSGDGGPASAATFEFPQGIVLDAAGQIFFIADTDNHRIRRIDSGGIIGSFAGGASQNAFLGDDGPAWRAALSKPYAIAVDSANRLFIADSENSRVRRVDPASGLITTVAGTERYASYNGDNKPAIQASLKSPKGVTIDPSGNIYIADTGNHRVRKVDAFGTITTIAGNGDKGFSPDNVLATQAMVDQPWGVAVDAGGNLYIAEFGTHRIRRVDRGSGFITTIAGNGQGGYSGDGVPATATSLFSPSAVAVDRSGNVFIADSDNHRIRKVDTNGIITTVAGNGSFDYYGEGGAATAAAIARPLMVIVDEAGNLFISGILYRVVRVDAVTKILKRVAGSGLGFSGDGGPALSAGLRLPAGLALDSARNLYIADRYNDRIRVVKGPLP